MTPPPFVPAWWVRNTHLQTLWGKLARRLPAAPTVSERWVAPDGDELELHRLKSGVGQPRVVILHGLEGSVRSHYAQGLLWQAHRRNWNADLLIFRSCGTVESSAPRMYHSGETSDIAWVLDRLTAEDPGCRIGLVGVSLGGNVLLKLLGEKRDAINAQVRAAVAISVPYDLEKSSLRINRGFSRVYQWHFMRTLRRKARAKLAQHPHLADSARVASSRTMFDYDDAMTAPVHGFRDAKDYYARSSSINWLKSIAVPTLLLSAVDDPFLPAPVLDEVRARAAENTNLEVEFHAHGGHVGFISGNSPFDPVYYAERRAADFISTFIA